MKNTAARIVRYARRRAGLSQNALAEKVGVPQSMIARIEKGRVAPRFETVLKLLRGCGLNLEIEPLLGQGVDRTLIREMLHFSPTERAQYGAAAARNLARFESLIRK